MFYAATRLTDLRRNLSGLLTSGSGLAAHAELQVLLRPGADAIERLLDVFDRVGHAEAQIAFAEVAKRSPRERGDAGVFEQRVGQFLRWPPGSLDVGENVERALRQAAGEPFDLVEAGDHNIPPFLELGAHRPDRLLRST